jgi:hypothetical protein
MLLQNRAPRSYLLVQVGKDTGSPTLSITCNVVVRLCAVCCRLYTLGCASVF